VKNVATYVGIDAHTKDLFIAILIGTAAVPVTWTVPNEPAAIRRLVRKLEGKAPGPILTQLCTGDALLFPPASAEQLRTPSIPGSARNPHSPR
jgi:hypothetical protein